MLLFSPSSCGSDGTWHLALGSSHAPQPWARVGPRSGWTGGGAAGAQRRVPSQGLSLVLSEGSLRDGEEKEPAAEEDSGDAETLQSYQWLLRDLPRLPLFDSVRATTALALQQVRPARRAAGPRSGPRSQLTRLPPGHPHGDRPADRQRLPGVPVPAHARGGAGPAQRPGPGEGVGTAQRPGPVRGAGLAGPFLGRETPSAQPLPRRPSFQSIAERGRTGAAWGQTGRCGRGLAASVALGGGQASPDTWGACSEQQMRCGSAPEGSGLLGQPQVFRRPCPASPSLLGMRAAGRGHTHAFPSVRSSHLAFF